jgi:peptide/nickel transport system substrate-binding protein
MFPTVSQLPSKIVVNMNMNPNDVDNRLLAGDAQVDFAGTGVQAAARAKILSNPSLKAQSDDPITGFGWFFYRLAGGAVHQPRLPSGDPVRG